MSVFDLHLRKMLLIKVRYERFLMFLDKKICNLFLIYRTLLLQQLFPQLIRTLLLYTPLLLPALSVNLFFSLFSFFSRRHHLSLLLLSSRYFSATAAAATMPFPLPTLSNQMAASFDANSLQPLVFQLLCVSALVVVAAAVGCHPDNLQALDGRVERERVERVAIHKSRRPLLMCEHTINCHQHRGLTEGLLPG